MSSSSTPRPCASTRVSSTSTIAMTRAGWLACSSLASSRRVTSTPKQQRALRDLLRRRSFLVRQRTANLLSIKNLYSRQTGSQVPTKDIKRLTAEQVAEQFTDPWLAQAITCGVNVADALKTEIVSLEKTILEQARQRPEFALLESIPGIGQDSRHDHPV